MLSDKFIQYFKTFRQVKKWLGLLASKMLSDKFIQYFKTFRQVAPTKSQTESITLMSITATRKQKYPSFGYKHFYEFSDITKAIIYQLRKADGA